MIDISINNNHERRYTQSEMEAITRNVVRQMDVEKEERDTGAEIPVKISDALANTPPHHLQKNSRKLKRET
ncbi:hypothetical protein G6F57_017970 [Rhizopus arrhizus]|nr:hypothetical protein G6F23_013303 [Rhizopus arrhizus]KAG0924548.1 hypothetical protein G6F30_013598 [Rhizopus arrhizus]KAG0972266.1 hypothetical protein G6F29_013593 [Rhizopus arrhizus]KAG0973546.1 hypothetical protein G6F28_013572 [Rhizopus arrhizus]KAG1000679.1 hypothetical protein G6F27_013589 [Rhizopus arrhizus]